MMMNFKSHKHGIIWPAKTGPLGSEILALLFQMEKSQYYPPEEILKKQFLQLNAIFHHSRNTVPFYRKNFKEAGLLKRKQITPDSWHNVPILTRNMVRQYQEYLLSKNTPKSHGRTSLVQTSGSTGVPVKVIGTQITGLLFMACALRDHFWHQRDFSAKMAVIRVVKGNKGEYPGTTVSTWGNATAAVLETGPLVMLNSGTDISLQAQFLIREQPEYLFTYPSNLEALAKYFIKEGIELHSLKEARTLGEILGSEVRPACYEAWGVPVVDVYSAQEVGYIALQCPENNDIYHIQSENLFVEIVDEEGLPCREGEIGRVLISTLHNYAMPLIRYEIGDYAEVGSSACSCGRTLPVLSKVLGRKRNMIIHPNGGKSWPSLGRITKEMGPLIKQFQFVQKSFDLIEVRLVTGRELTDSEENKLKIILQETLKHTYEINIIYLDSIARSKGGKFEDFISEVA